MAFVRLLMCGIYTVEAYDEHVSSTIKILHVLQFLPFLILFIFFLLFYCSNTYLGPDLPK